jgi:hypothetical protein
MGQRRNSFCLKSSRIGNEPFRPPALPFAFSFSKNGVEFLRPSRNLLRVGHGAPLDDGCPLRAAFGGAHVSFVVVVDGFRIAGAQELGEGFFVRPLGHGAELGYGLLGFLVILLEARAVL